MSASSRPEPIPLTILTGFLGAGKTTLLNRILRDPAFADTLVVINEFGEVGLDHLLVENVEQDLVLLSAGCLCCTVRGDLVSALEDLLRRRDNGRIAPFRRVVIETTGLADPAPVLASVLYHPYLSQRFAVMGVVTVVDAVHGADTIVRHPEAARQVAVADTLVVTKRDGADPAAARSLADALDRLNPAATRVDAGEALEPATLAGGGLFDASAKIADVAAWLRAEKTAHGHHHHHDVNRHSARIRSFVLWADRPLGHGPFDMMLDLIRTSFGPRILRLKGLVAFADDPGRPVVIHGVQHVLHVPAVLPAWPSDDHRSRLVFIVEDVPEDAVPRLWDAFTGRLMTDQPDAAALTDNPLAPATLRL